MKMSLLPLFLAFLHWHKCGIMVAPGCPPARPDGVLAVNMGPQHGLTRVHPAVGLRGRPGSACVLVAGESLQMNEWSPLVTMAEGPLCHHAGVHITGSPVGMSPRPCSSFVAGLSRCFLGWETMGMSKYTLLLYPWGFFLFLC